VARNYTVMYKGIPHQLLSQYTPMEIFSRYFPGEVVDAQVGLNAGRLRKLIKNWDKNQKKLEFAQAALAEHGTHTTKRLNATTFFLFFSFLFFSSYFLFYYFFSFIFLFFYFFCFFVYNFFV
jgi:hypothetical protein